MTVYPSFLCIHGIFGMLSEQLDHLGAVQYLVGLNPIEDKCYVQLILLFYLLHQGELPWKMSCGCKSLGEKLATSISSAALQPLDMPHCWSCNVHQLLQMQGSCLLDSSSSSDACTATSLIIICVYKPEENLRLFSMTVIFAILADATRACRYCGSSRGLIC